MSINVVDCPICGGLGWIFDEPGCNHSHECELCETRGAICIDEGCQSQLERQPPPVKKSA